MKMRFFAITALVIIPWFCKAQNHSSEVWSDISLSTKIAKDLKADVVFKSKNEFFNSDIYFKSTYIDFGFGYELTKKIDIGISQKITFKEYENGCFSSYTSIFQLQYTQKLNKRLRLSYRNKSEFGKSTYTNELNDTYFEIENRNRLKLTYSRKKYKFKPSVYIESFHPIEAGNTYWVSEMRYGTGVNFDLKKKFEFEVGYLYKQVYNSKQPESCSIISLSLSKGL